MKVLTDLVCGEGHFAGSWITLFAVSSCGRGKRALRISQPFFIMSPFSLPNHFSGLVFFFFWQY
jgi:hypothetical protein